MKDECNVKIFGSNLSFQGIELLRETVKSKKLQKFYVRVCSMLIGVGLKDEVRSKIWALCTMTIVHSTMTNEAPPEEKADKNKKNHCQLRNVEEPSTN
jgi:hypothetical protein